MKKYFANSKIVSTFALVFETQKGRVAERLGTGLQNLLLRFKSGRDLKKTSKGTFQKVPFHFVPIPFFFQALKPSKSQNHII